MNAYVELERRFAEIDAIDGALSILHWDCETMMPPGAIDVRSEQLATLAGISHAKLSDAALPDLLAQAEESTAALTDWQQANLREMRHQWVHANALPADLVQALSKATSACEHDWREARKTNDFPRFAAQFREVLRLTQEAATIKAEALNLSPYDALLDAYDPGMRASQIDSYFTQLEAFLPDFIDEVLCHQARNPAPTSPKEAIPIARQSELGVRFMQALGFDFEHGRIDTSTHPFCGGVPGDIRLTTRYSETTFTESLYGVLHETGHALYEMGLPHTWIHQPVGKARGMSLHESQSLLIEMQLCLSRDFVAYAAPLIRDAFGVSGSAWEEESLYRQLTQVKRSLIRVDADEATYPLHVMLRYRLEQALLSGDLPINDLPGAWDDGMHALLQIRPDCVGNGCLQDTHWPGGAIGYFPTYTIGAMIAAQLMDSARTALPDLSAQIRRGEFAPLIGWLNTHVHGLGSKLSTPELVTQATGQPLNVAIYQAHLKQRYLGE